MITRKADLAGRHPGAGGGRRAAPAARDGREADSAIVSRARALSPISRMSSTRGPMKVMPQAAADLREIGVFGEVAVSRMDRLGVRDLCRGDDAGDVQVDFRLRERGRCRRPHRRIARGANRASASEWTATVRIPSSRQALTTRRAISPRFAMRILRKHRPRVTPAGSGRWSPRTRPAARFRRARRR